MMSESKDLRHDEAQGPGVPEKSTWLITANVVKERPYRPEGKEKRVGTKHFRGGAKVYIVSAYWGICESVTAIGHHRHSRRFTTIEMRLCHLENLRLSVSYSPKVMSLVAERYANVLPTKSGWEAKLKVIQSWPDA